MGFLEKGESPEDFLTSVASWCRKYEETYLTVSLARSISGHEGLIGQLNMVGRSQAMADIATRVSRYAGKSENVLILGETGTGKERIARALHKLDASQFFPVNCAAYNGQLELMESDLFDYVKGAFTGAQKDHVGVFEAAKHGTVFLDEVHTLDLRAQQKLLRVIQEKSVRPVGSNREFKVNFRLLAAAKAELETLVEKAHDKQRFVCAARRGFREPLQNKHVLPMRVERGELKELAQLVYNQQQTVGLLVSDDLRIGVEDGVYDLLIARLRLCTK